MIIRGLHVEHWRCIAKLDLDDLPCGIVVLHGPNRTGKSSLVKALRGCLFDFDHDTTRAELKSCLPRNNNGPPKLAVDFECAGQLYRITKVFSKKSDGLTRLEQQCDGRWRILDDSPKEASRRTRELLGADKSTLGLNQLLWLDQGEIHLPNGKDLDGSLERRLVSVLGVMVTGRDLHFKQVLDKRCDKWFGVAGRHKPTSPVSRWEKQTEERRAKRDEQLAKRREIEQTISDMEDCESRLPELVKASLASRQELAEREQERDRGRERRQQYQQALRDFRTAEQRDQSARQALQTYQDAKARWQEAETKAVRAEAGQAAAREDRERCATEHARIEAKLQAARQAEERSQPGQEDIEDRRKLFQWTERGSRLAKDLERVRQLQQRTEDLEKHLQESAVPDKSSLEGLRDNRQKAGKYRAQLHAGQLTLNITFAHSTQLQLRLDGDEARVELLPPGQPASWQFRQRARVDLSDVGSIEVTRGQENLDLERSVEQLAKLDNEYRQTILAFREQPDDEGCLNRLTERWADRESALAKLSEVRSELRQLAPHGLITLESEWSRLDNQRQIILERRPDLIDWQPSDEELHERERELRAESTRLQKTRKDLEAAEKQATQALHKAQTADWECSERAIAARTAAKSAFEELQRLGDDLSLQAALRQAEEVLASAQRRLIEAELNEAEKTIEQRCQDAHNALRLREERLQQLKDEMNRHRGRLEGSEGLHTRLADAEAALQESEELLARERLEAEAHKHLRDLFEACRDSQVQEVMGPIGGRVLGWTQALGLSEYREVRFGDRFLPEGLVLRDSQQEGVQSLAEESYGTGEQLGLLVRLAMGGVLAKDEPAVTILDDPLAHADSVKHRRILDIMRQAAEGNSAWIPPAGRLQVLIFTCHPDRFDYLTGVRQIDLATLILREV